MRLGTLTDSSLRLPLAREEVLDGGEYANDVVFTITRPATVYPFLIDSARKWWMSPTVESGETILGV